MGELLQILSVKHIQSTEKQQTVDNEFLICARALNLLVSLTQQFLMPRKPPQKIEFKPNNNSLEGMTWQELLSFPDNQSLVRELPPCFLQFNCRVYGREKDVNQIVDFLVSDDGNTDTNINVSVFAIVGEDGIGKTTLAHAVYKHHRVKAWFNLRVWVTFPSYQLDAGTLAKIILGILNVCFHPDDDDLQELMLLLQKRLIGKRFLLVLDGYSVVRDWEILRTCFESAVKGSAIIITTRTTEAALEMLADHVLHLSFLTMEDCWSVFSGHCFRNGRLGCDPQLEVVGKRILKKCGGVPLAAKMMGGLLHDQDYKVWVEIWRSKQWDSMDAYLPAPFVRLCYLYLPSELKQCITYLAMFPKGYKFQKKQMVLLWMAEGFIQHENSTTMEKLGNEYFNFLVARSFLMRSHNGGSVVFTMHDLVHDLALFISQKFRFIIDGNDASYPASNSARYLSCYPTLQKFSQKFWELHPFPCVRTFLSLPFSHQFLPESVSSQLCTNILSLSSSKYLRVLSLSHFNIVKLPVPMRRLRYLRYLNLSFTAICTLPVSIGLLHNLQTLLLSFCDHLRELPSSMANLINLHHLDIRGTQMTHLPDFIGNLRHLHDLNLSFSALHTLPESIGGLSELQSLKLSFCRFLRKLPIKLVDLINLHHLDIRGTNIWHMPLQMGRLTNLQILTDFIVGNNGSEVAELAGLSKIHTLCITGLHNVANATDALDAKLKEKGDLIDLSLRWNQMLYSKQDVSAHQVLENFEPPKGVKRLELLGYPGAKFPNWLMDALFATLEVLDLRGCMNCSFLPPLGKLPFLKELFIAGCDKLVSIGAEFHGMAAMHVPFQSLEILWIADMLNWREWIVSEVEGIGFQCLRELYLMHCPQLVQGLPNYLPSLVKLQISECNNLTASLPKMPENCELLLHDCNEILMGSVVKLTSTSSELKDDISEEKHEVSSLANRSHDPGPHSPAVEVNIPINTNDAGQNTSDYGTCFETLKISDVSQLVELPSTLHSLRIEGCNSMESLQLVPMKICTNLFELYIIDCCSLKYFADGWHPGSLRTLYVHKCRKLEFPLPVKKMQNFDNLEHLSIGSSCDSLKSFTLNLFPKLRILCIWDCPNLESLSNLVDGCQNNNLSLESLEIRDCPSLVSFPREGLLSPSLRSLSVSNCKNLTSLPNYMTTLTSLQSLFIDRCPELESLPAGGLPSSLTLLSIACCDKLKPQKEWKLQRLHCLSRFELESGCKGLKSFPEKDILPINLNSLHISKLPGLQVLDYNGLQQLTALDSLEINCCKNLCSLPEALPPSLTFLCIKESSKLTQKLLNQAGEDWLKIAHICSIQIDNSVISSNSTGASFLSRSTIPISSST